MAKCNLSFVLQFSRVCPIQVCNIIFLDSPVGAGFSYSDTEQGYISSDTKAVDQILIFLREVTSLAIYYLNTIVLKEATTVVERG